MHEDGRRLTPHLVRSIFERRKTENIVREIALHQAVAAIAPQAKPKDKEKPMAANTGARGYAAMLKAEMASLRAEFSKLHDETKAELDQMRGHLQTGREQRDEMRAQNKELREAHGMENDTSAS